MTQHRNRPKLLVYGNGQMARMLISFFADRFEVVGFTVDRHVIGEPFIAGLPVVPFDAVETAFPPAEHLMITAVGFLEMNDLRARKFEEGQRKGYRFTNYIHSSVVQHANLSLGTNNILLDHLALHPDSSLGNSNFISSNVSIGHGCRIGDNCWINGGVGIGGEVSIGDNAFLGLNATVVDNITLGAGTYVGANTLMTRDTRANEVFISAAGERFPLPSREFLSFLAKRRD